MRVLKAVFPGSDILTYLFMGTLASLMNLYISFFPIFIAGSRPSSIYFNVIYTTNYQVISVLTFAIHVVLLRCKMYSREDRGRAIEVDKYSTVLSTLHNAIVSVTFLSFFLPYFFLPSFPILTLTRTS